jgi:putative nucleotidyltransferase with HDIG domain
MDKYNMPLHIRQHSLVVCEIALSIARALKETGENINLDEVRAAALLHDITKQSSIQTGENHAETGAELLRKLGYGRIAEIVQAHIIPRDGGTRVTAEEVVSYADKRVIHDQKVSLDERFDYLIKRYGRDESAVQRIKNMGKRMQAIEEKIQKRTKLVSEDKYILQKKS